MLYGTTSQSYMYVYTNITIIVCGVFCACRVKLHLMTLVIVILYYDSFNTGVSDMYLWQSRVEIEGYSVAYFDRIAAFEAPYR